MTLNLQDRRIVTALAGVFMLGLACVLLLGLGVLVLCAMLVNALVSTIAETVTTVGTLYSHTGPLAHLLMLLAVLFGVPYSFKRLRTPALRFFQRQFARFTTFAQQQTPSASNSKQENHDYEEGEVIDLDAAEEARQARTTAASHAAGSRRTATGRSRKQRKKHSRHAATARAVLALTHA